MIKTIIVDDSSSSRMTLHKILTNTFANRFSIVAMCESADEAKIAIEKFFKRIQMYYFLKQYLKI
jgi:hypothetical protein